jgi:hypothetical protein
MLVLSENLDDDESETAVSEKLSHYFRWRNFVPEAQMGKEENILRYLKRNLQLTDMSLGVTREERVNMARVRVLARFLIRRAG